MVTYICSLKDAATIVQQEFSYFNVAHCCSCQKGSLTILQMRSELHTHNTWTVVQPSLDKIDWFSAIVQFVCAL